MKLTTLFTVCFGIATITLSAQEISNHALGLRLGDSDGFGVEISYQKALQELNRLEVDLGLRNTNNYDAFKLTGLYQWVRLLDDRFNWYYGVGGGLGSVDFKQSSNDEDGFFAFIAGDIGVEYNFDIPLLISLDFRPELGLVGYDAFDNDFDFDIALGLRYQF